MGFPTKNDHFRVHHLRKHPYCHETPSAAYFLATRATIMDKVTVTVMWHVVGSVLGE